MTTESYGALSATSLSTVLTSGAIHTKGAYVELAASTGIDCEWMTIYVSKITANKETILLDIATGAPTETVVIPNVCVYTNPGGFGVSVLTLPIHIPSGTEISACIQATAATVTCEIAIVISDEAAFGTGATSVETLGADTAVSFGTNVDPGATANTEGAWSELSASTSSDIDYLTLMIDGSDNNAVSPAQEWLIDIGTGAASSEVVLIADIIHKADAAEGRRPSAQSFFANIPSGTRVAVRAQCSTNTATDRVFAASILGCNMTAPAGGAASGARNPLVGPIG